MAQQLDLRVALCINIPLFKGSSAFGSRNKYCRPTKTEFRLSTGFQSSRKMFKQTLPSRSTFGW